MNSLICRLQKRLRIGEVKLSGEYYRVEEAQSNEQGWGRVNFILDICLLHKSTILHNQYLENKLSVFPICDHYANKDYLSYLHYIESLSSLTRSSSSVPHSAVTLFFPILIQGHSFIDFRKRGRERKREGERQKYPCESETSISWLLHMLQLGTEPTTFWFTGLHSNQLSHRPGHCYSFLILSKAPSQSPSVPSS